MISHFSKDTDILIRHRQDSVGTYMSPAVQGAAPHFHYQYELLLTVGGSADFVIAGVCYHIEPGSILFMSNMENHYILSSSPNYDRYTLRFSNEVLAAYLRDPLLLSIFKQRPEHFCHQYHCTPEQLGHFTHLAQLIEQEYQAQAPYWDQIILSRVLTILVEMYRTRPESFPAHQSAESQSLIFNVQNYIESHLQEELTLDAVAGRFFVNKFHLSHSFSRVTGYTFKRYIILARIAKAKDLLLNSNEEVSAISQQVGFNNVSHFIRTFKGCEDISPLQYRNRARK